MSVAKVMEISSRSPESFEHAIKSGLERAKKTVDNIQGAWVKEQKVELENGDIKNFRVDMKITFILND